MDQSVRIESSFCNQNKEESCPIKLLRIDGSGYLLTENQIRKWIDLYGEIKSDLLEEAEEDGEDGICTGTGAYLVSVRLYAKIPNLIPMFGQQISIFHEGIEKTCRKCFKNRKKRWNVWEENGKNM